MTTVDSSVFFRFPKSRLLVSCALVASCLCSCSNPEFKRLGTSILSATGMVSASDADALFEAGGKLAKAATPLSEEEEYYLGRGVSASVLSQYKATSSGEPLRYINKVAAVVAANSGRPETFGGYHVAILESSEINAVSAPGGFIFLSRGLLSSLKDEDQLAAILAHEVGHVALAHGVNAISQANLTEAVSLIGKQAATSYGGAEVSQLTSLFGDSIKDVTDTLLKKGYGRSQEYAADLYAAAVLTKAGYRPQALLEVLEMLKSHEGKEKGGWYDTHPAPEKRISEIKSEINPQLGSDGADTRKARFQTALKR